MRKVTFVKHKYDIVQKAFRSHPSNLQFESRFVSSETSLCLLEASVRPGVKSARFQSNNQNNMLFMPCPVSVSQTAAFLFLPCRETHRLDRADRCCPSQRYFIHTSLWNNVNSAHSSVLFILRSILERSFSEVSHWLNFVLRPFSFSQGELHAAKALLVQMKYYANIEEKVKEKLSEFMWGLF